MKSQLMVVLFVFALWSCNVSTSEKPADSEPVVAETPTATVAQRPVEFADDKLSAICKEAMTKLAAGDVEGFTSLYADDAVYRWNSGGDSLAGKPAIVKYWTERRGNVITKLEFTDDIWLALRVTDANSTEVRKGDWVLGWYTTHATYKTGKSIHQAMHMLFHFNAQGKVDEIIHYLDRGEVKAAASK
jgi:ketosteroid isomerase-like protein